MLARIQQAIVVALSAALGGWIFGFVRAGHPFLALLGPILAFTLYGGALALEFCWLRRSYRRAPTDSPSADALVRAWWKESTWAPRVFLWAQPFRSSRCPDRSGRPGQRGVVLVHGFFCNRGFWNPWLKRLTDEDVPFVAVDLEPVTGSIDTYASIVDAAVAGLEQSTGRPPIIVAHSMGGLAARAWLHRHRAGHRCDAIVTIGTPHAGTWMGRFARSANAREMGLGSSWLTALREAEADARRAPFVCWWSDCDNIVFPTAGATLPGADNRLVRGEPHVALAFHPRILEDVMERLRPPGERPAPPPARG